MISERSPDVEEAGKEYLPPGQCTGKLSITGASGCRKVPLLGYFDAGPKDSCSPYPKRLMHAV